MRTPDLRHQSRRAVLGRGVTLVGVLASLVLLVSPHAHAGGWRLPPFTNRFQYQLQTGSSGPGGIDLTLCAATDHSSACLSPLVVDIDLYGPDGRTPNVAAVRAIHARGGYAICYVDAGTWEAWRPDASHFPRALLGRANGWPGERWLDIRRVALLITLMTPRVLGCARAGFDAVEFDNVDGYANSTGFPLTSSEQIRYNLALANLAHRFGLAVGLKNDDVQAARLASTFDFAVDEQCVQYRECGLLEPFLRRRHPVFDVEYRGSLATACARSVPGLTVVTKALSLRASPWGVCA